MRPAAPAHRKTTPTIANASVMSGSTSKRKKVSGVTSTMSPQFTTKLAMFCATRAAAESALRSFSSSSAYFTTSPTLPNGDASLTPCPAMLVRAKCRYGTRTAGFPAHTFSTTESHSRPQRCALHVSTNPQPTARMPPSSVAGPSRYTIQASAPTPTTNSAT
jgi:hypothetical protein